MGQAQPAWDAFINSLLGRGLIIVAYLSLNLSLNLSNKWVLSLYGFRFPLFLSICHMVFSFAALGPVMVAKPFRALHRPTLEKQWMGLLAVGCFFAINIGFNNVSLLSISLSLNQVIRSSIPVVTALASVFVENKSPSRQELTSLVVLVSGVAIAVWEGSGTKSSVVGLLMCIAGTICNGLMMSFSGRIMSEKLDVLRLTFYTAPVVTVVLLPFYAGVESQNLAQYRATATGHGYVVLILLTCTNALAYNMVHYLMIKITSAVTTTVLGEMKIVLILILSAMLLNEGGIWTMQMLVGCSTAILGFCMYSHCKLRASPPAAQPVIKGVPDLAPSLSGDRAPLLPKAHHGTNKQVSLSKLGSLKEPQE